MHLMLVAMEFNRARVYTVLYIYEKFLAKIVVCISDTSERLGTQTYRQWWL